MPPYVAPRRRFVLELVLDVPDGMRWPADGRDVDDVDLVVALVATRLGVDDVLTRLVAGHIEPLPS